MRVSGSHRIGRCLAVLAVLTLAACSGARGTGGSSSSPPSAPEASRFLTQASFGPTDASISQVRSSGYGQWIDEQMAAPQSTTHLEDLTARLAVIRATNPAATLQAADVYWTFWRHAATDQDQLRERMKLALSEIFVISLTDTNVRELGAGSYYDMLGANAFGNFRTLLEQVTLHPMMGVYLTWLGNQKEDPVTGRNPDENYAREVMQLMTIGVVQLNQDGTPKTDNQGRPLPSYTTDDIAGLAKVFTGYSYYSPTPTSTTFAGRNLPADATTRSMIPYPTFHSLSAKTFLGVSIPASGVSNPSGDLKIALDTLFNHPNVGPFISRQLIQRLVTSNPSTAYVSRVAGVFNNNGRGVRGDMSAVVRAILLDTEARTLSADANTGKIREPLLRMSSWMRAFGAASDTGEWRIGSTSANTSLGQTVLTSPSVFNFFRPGYSPPNSRIGNAGLVAPELQIVDEVTVSGYLNTMQTTIDLGIGATANGLRDVRAPYAAEIALANDTNALVDRVNLLLLGGQMSSTLRTRIVDSVNAITVPTTGSQTTALTNRSKLAIYMTMASSEFMVQR